MSAVPPTLHDMPDLSDSAQSWIAALAGLASVFAVFWSIRTGIRQGKATRTYQEGMEKLQRRQAEAQERLVSVLAGSPPPGRGTQSANISMKMVPRGRGHRLVITNMGPGQARVMDVQSLSDPNLLVEPLGLDDLVLMPGETHEILAAPSLATPPHPKVLVTWLGGDGTTHSREQSVGL